MAEIQAILFDFGGVLAEEGFSGGLESLAREQALNVSDMTEQGLAAVYDSGYVVGKGTEAGFWSLMRERTGLHGSDEELTRHVLDGFVMRPWMLDLVRRLSARGYVTGILSDQTDWLDHLNARHGFYSLFDKVYNSYRMGKGKRDASVFDDVAADLGVPPSKILFIDDNAGHVVRAKSRGMRAIQFMDRSQLLQSLAAERV